MRTRLLPLWLLCVALGCAGGRSIRGAEPPPPGPVRDAPDSVWMDCQQDADCAARPGTVCHAAVMGGTCAPPCNDDAPCEVEAGLQCTAGHCVAATHPP